MSQVCITLTKCCVTGTKRRLINICAVAGKTATVNRGHSDRVSLLKDLGLFAKSVRQAQGAASADGEQVR